MTLTAEKAGLTSNRGALLLISSAVMTSHKRQCHVYLDLISS
ncbi:hypothetical protein ACED63_00555 [Vibrio splendidus]